MIQSRRGAPLVVLAAFIITLIFLRFTSTPGAWRDNIKQSVGLGEYNEQDDSGYRDDALPTGNVTARPSKPIFQPGIAKPNGHAYSKILVMPKVTKEDTSWIGREIPDWKTAIYIADDPGAELSVPENKGHEAMIYFTYIIDHYDELPDVVVFMHSHQYAWHNNELLASDAGEMLRRLSLDRVQRIGYFNMRCHWNPGCPAWMHPGTIDEDANRQEETLLAQAWSELFPNDPIPLVLAVPCCAQFAVSAERILARPKSDYEFYRNWLLQTNIADYLSGRIWEYLWPVVFAGTGFYCPEQNECYCDGYGMCFGGEDKFDEYYEIKNKKDGLALQLKEWQQKADKIAHLREQGKMDEAADIEVPELGKDVQLESKIGTMEKELSLRKEQALLRGQDPRVRAEESNRTWHQGDGF